MPGLQKCDSDACRCERAATAASGNSEALCDAVLGNAATNDADRASALRARAQIRSQAHRYDGAITDADEAIGIDMKIDDPFDAALAYDVRGNAHLQRNEDAAAFADFDSAVNEMPHDTRFGVARGLAYLAAGNLAKAARDFGDVIDSSQYPTSRVGSITMTLYDNHADAYWGRGVVRLLAVHYDEAAEDFTKTIALDPKSGIAAIWLHYVRERQGHDDSAELAANAAKLDPAGRAAAALKLFAGNAPAATANDVASGPESANGTCEGILAVAEWNKFSRHDDANAARAYRAVVGTCQRSVQTALAQAMLQTPPQVNLPR